MFLSLWAPSRHSFSLINGRLPQSNRCYSSNPSKFISSVKKNKTESPEPRAFTTDPHTDSLRRGTLRCEYEQLTWKTGPPLYPCCSPPAAKTTQCRRPSSPQTSLRRHFQNIDSFPNWIRSLQFQLSGQFQGFSHHCVFHVSVVWHRNHCYFSLSYRPSYNYPQGIPTLLQLKWLYGMETTVEQKGKYVFHYVFCGCWKKCWKVMLEKCFVFSSKPDLSLGIVFSVLWAVLEKVCSEVGLCK